METIVVGGALAAKPGNGGEAWVRLSWVLGLRRLGFDAWLWEEVDSPPDAEALSFFKRTSERHDLASRTVLISDGEPIGESSRADLEELAAAAVGLVNISGNIRDPSLLDRFERRAYVDLDPGFTQIWHAQGNLGGQLERHDRHFSVGLNLGGEDCEVPLGEIRWTPLPPPILLEEWTPPSAPELDRFTTVATWRNPLGRVEAGGAAYTLKHHQLRRFAQLPALARPRFELALEIHPDEEAESEELRRAGWEVVEAAAVSGDTASFREYVRGSGAEFSVAQGIYAETRSGWISDRTAHYLATGRPAVVQETGIPPGLRPQAGMVTFSDPAEAVAAVEAVAADYKQHSAAARDYAERTFDSDRVLGLVLEALVR